MFGYRIILFIIIILFYGCESSSDFDSNLCCQNFEILDFSINYNNQESHISIYVEVSDAQNILSLDARISNNGETFINDISLLQSDFNSNIFLYQGNLTLSNTIYLYDIDLIFYFTDETQGIFSDTFSSPVQPEIESYTIDDSFQLDSTNWTILTLDIEILNLNGLENIESVTYEVKRIYNGCENECNYDFDCNNPIEDLEYQSDPTWIFEYQSSSNLNQNHLYKIDIPMRPINGSALFDNEGNIIFPASDCGRSGIVLFKFIVIDQDGLMDEEIDIPLEIVY